MSNGDETVDPRIVDVVVLTVCGVIVFAGLAGAAALWMAIIR